LTATQIDCTSDCKLGEWLQSCGYRLVRETVDAKTLQIWETWTKEKDEETS
jgi:hypothetical protein